MKNLIITMGLPGSGKTYFSKSLTSESFSDKYYHLNVDNVMIKNDDLNNSNELKEQLLFKTKRFGNNYNNVIIDGLFLNINDIKFILNNIYMLPQKSLEIHYWKPNIENCLWNDRYRRDISSKNTIMNAKFELIDIKELVDYIENHLHNNIKVVLCEHEVIKKEDYKMFIDQFKIDVDDNYMMLSSTWSLGGEWWSYTGERGTNASEPQPEFIEFDNLLEKVCPAITFLQYKKLINYCVTIEERSVRDYYSSGTESYYQCDIEKLYDMLIEMDLLNSY